MSVSQCGGRSPRTSRVSNAVCREHPRFPRKSLLLQRFAQDARFAPPVCTFPQLPFSNHQVLLPIQSKRSKMARFLNLVLSLSLLTSAAAELCHLGNSLTTTGPCMGITMPMRTCDGASGGAGADEVTSWNSMAATYAVSGCEDDMKTICLLITVNATGVMGANACGISERRPSRARLPPQSEWCPPCPDVRARAWLRWTLFSRHPWLLSWRDLAMLSVSTLFGCL